MRKYGKAWETQDSKLILDCFIENGVYQESPLAKPYVGHKEIEEFWERVVCQNQENIGFQLKDCYVEPENLVHQHKR